jgi:hypothetical protein
MILRVLRQRVLGDLLVEVTVNSKEETLKTFVPITSKNLVTVHEGEIWLRNARLLFVMYINCKIILVTFF